MNLLHRTFFFLCLPFLHFDQCLAFFKGDLTSNGVNNPSYSDQKPSYSPPELSTNGLNIGTPSLPSLPKLPSFQIPKLKLPSLRKPSLTLPKLPRLKSPQFSFNLPKPKLPKFSLPSLSLPRLPKPQVPSVSIPKLPKFSLPQPQIPSVSLPKLPKFSVPQPQIPSFPSPNIPTYSATQSLTLPSLPTFDMRGLLAKKVNLLTLPFQLVKNLIGSKFAFKQQIIKDISNIGGSASIGSKPSYKPTKPEYAAKQWL